MLPPPPASIVWPAPNGRPLRKTNNGYTAVKITDDTYQVARFGQDLGTYVATEAKAANCTLTRIQREE